MLAALWLAAFGLWSAKHWHVCVCVRKRELWAVVNCVSLHEPPPAQPAAFLGERDSRLGWQASLRSCLQYLTTLQLSRGGMGRGITREEIVVSVKK